jgi:hypothetical protein
MRPVTVLPLLRSGVLDSSLTSLVWLLVEGGLPLVVTGSAASGARVEAAGALLSIDPSAAWLVLDADVEPATLSRLSALLQGGARIGISVAAPDLSSALERLHAAPGRLPYDAIRRLGIVVTLDQTARGPRCRLVHLLRPTERDAHGHVQRRPPAILASWDEAADRYDDYAWAITPELGERIGLRQAEVETRQRARARMLAATAGMAHIDMAGWEQRVREHLAAERA